MGADVSTAMNGGAAVAVLQNENILESARDWSCGAFVAGIVLALLTATVGARRGTEYVKRLTLLQAYWTGVSIDLLRSEEIEKEWQEFATADQRGVKPAAILGYLSPTAFLIGCIFIAAGN